MISVISLWLKLCSLNFPLFMNLLTRLSGKNKCIGYCGSGVANPRGLFYAGVPTPPVFFFFYFFLPGFWGTKFVFFFVGGGPRPVFFFWGV
jgi:hypothetical protein